MRRGQKGFNGLKIGFFIGRVPSDDAVGMAVKGLRQPGVNLRRCQLSVE